MKRTIIALCAAALAAPLSFTAAPAVAQSMSIEIGDPGYRARRGFHRRGDWYYYNGYRGFRDRRPGYRYHSGYWFPPAAFALGAITGSIIAGEAQRRPSVSYTNAHEEWCYDRYRSYRSSDNTFQPYNGPRRQCVSPYS